MSTLPSKSDYTQLKTDMDFVNWFVSAPAGTVNLTYQGAQITVRNLLQIELDLLSTPIGEPFIIETNSKLGTDDGQGALFPRIASVEDDLGTDDGSGAVFPRLSGSDAVRAGFGAVPAVQPITYTEWLVKDRLVSLVVDEAQTPTPGAARSGMGGDRRTYEYVEASGRRVNFDTHGRPVKATHTAFNREQLAVACPWGAKDSDDGFYTKARTVWPVFWTRRGATLEGDVEWHDGVLQVPAPSGGTARYPLPYGAQPKTSLSNILMASITDGQSLGDRSVTTFVNGQRTYKGVLEFGGINPHPNLVMFNGGIRSPGKGGNGRTTPYTVDATQQASLVPAVDQLSGDDYDLYAGDGVTVVEQNVKGYSTSADIAGGIVASLTPTGDAFGHKRMMVNLSQGERSIVEFLSDFSNENVTTAQNHFNKWFKDTVQNMKAAAVADGRTLRIDRILFWQGQNDVSTQYEADGTTPWSYRTRLDTYVSERLNYIEAETGYRPRVYQDIHGNALTSAGAILPRHPQQTINRAALDILAKGISDAVADKDYVCTGPNYELAYASISHMVPFSYLLADQRKNWIANLDQSLRLRGQKFKPTHMSGNAVQRYFVDFESAIGQGVIKNKWVLEVPIYTPLGQVTRRTDLIRPRGLDEGFECIGGNTPSIERVLIGDNRDTVILVLSERFTGTDRELGAAYRASMARQGQLATPTAPDGVYQNVGCYTTVCDDAPHTCVVSGFPLVNWLSPQIVTVEDEI